MTSPHQKVSEIVIATAVVIAICWLIIIYTTPSQSPVNDVSTFMATTTYQSNCAVVIVGNHEIRCMPPEEGKELRKERNERLVRWCTSLKRDLTYEEFVECDDAKTSLLQAKN